MSLPSGERSTSSSRRRTLRRVLAWLKYLLTLLLALVVLFTELQG